MTQKAGKEDTSILLSALDNYGGAPFDEIFDIVFPAYSAGEVEAASQLSDKVAVVIWGGADISPSIYGQKANRFTGPDEPSAKDKLEMEIALKAMELGMPIIGVCRGAQLMCALSGGTLIQHVENHANGWHGIVMADGTKLQCPSLHHQMMYPYQDGQLIPDKEIIAWADPTRSKVYKGPPNDGIEGTDGEDIKVPEGFKEPEIVWFNKTKALCIQSHPEFIRDVKHPFVQFCLKLIKEKFHLEKSR